MAMVIIEISRLSFTIWHGYHVKFHVKSTILGDLPALPNFTQSLCRWSNFTELNRYFLRMETKEHKRMCTCTFLFAPPKGADDLPLSCKLEFQFEFACALLFKLYL